jgi:hypothetical protein
MQDMVEASQEKKKSHKENIDATVEASLENMEDNQKKTYQDCRNEEEK